MSHAFEYGARVLVDGQDIGAIVTAFSYRPGLEDAEVSYWCNGDHKSVWLPLWRLKLA